MKTRRITLFGIPFDTVSESQALLKLHYYSQLPEGAQYVCLTPNPEMIVEAASNKPFYDILRRSDFSVADGTGILWASGFLELSVLDLPVLFPKKLQFKNVLAGIVSLLRFLFWRKGFPAEIKERVTGTDVCGRFLATSQSKVFLLGGREGAAAELAQKFPNVTGYYDGEVNDEALNEIVLRINLSKAEVLFVALGSPKQEFWIASNLAKLPTVRFAMGVGGAFDFLSGVRRRAPAWMRRAGLEWLFRLFREPWRLGRMWKATVGFFLLTVRQKG